MKRKLLTVLMVLLTATLCFASGAREIADDETIVKVLSIDVEDDGVYRATVLSTDGTVIVYRASEEETVCSVPFEQIHVGSVLAVKDNGIMTMSIPAQMWATEIRDITLGVGAGAYDITFAEPEGVYADVIAQESTGAALWPMSVADDLESRFSYSYAYDLVNGYAAQGVVFRGPYYVRGIMDFWNGSEPLTPLQSMAEDVNLYIDTIFMNGVAETTGPVPSSMDEIEAISSFDDISQRFSYAYGYASAYQDYMSGITVDLEDYVNGALTAVYGGAPLLDEDERSSSITEYVEHLSEQYLAYIEQMAADNLLSAENFLEENAGVEGMVVTQSGLQYEVVREGDGARPTMDDTVIVNYTLRDIDGNLLESSDGSEFALSGLIPGFAEAVLNMNVGGEVIAYLHPSLGYGENGAGSIEPNSLLVFDIELTGIVED